MKYLVILIFSLSSLAFAKTPPIETAQKLVPWSSPEGMKRFERANKTDFYQLANFFETQSNGIFCGPTSAIIVLNALRIGSKKKAPKKDLTVLSKAERKYLPLRYDAGLNKYTQHSFFSAPEKFKSKIEVLGKPTGKKHMADYGFQLRQYNKALKAHGLNTILRVVHDKLDEKKIREDLVKNLQTSDDFVLINYSRKTLGQKGGGHISPLGAYDTLSDSFLILDVNPNRAPWVWVKTADLIASMRTFDTVENRGYVMVSEGH